MRTPRSSPRARRSKKENANRPSSFVAASDIPHAPYWLERAVVPEAQDAGRLGVVPARARRRQWARICRGISGFDEADRRIGQNRVARRPPIPARTDRKAARSKRRAAVADLD